MRVDSKRLGERALWKKALAIASVFLLGVMWLMARKIAFNKAEIAADKQRILTEGTGVTSMVFTNSNTLLVGSTGSYSQWDVRRKVKISQVGTDLTPERFACEVNLNADGQSFWQVADDSNVLYFYDGSLRREGHYHRMALHWGNSPFIARTLAFDHNSRLMVLNTADTTHPNVSIWNTRTGQLQTVLQTQKHGFYGGWAAAPDGGTVATGTDDDCIALYNAHNGTLLKTLRGSLNSLQALKFFSDGRRLTVGGTGRGFAQRSYVEAWDVAKGKRLKTFHSDFNDLCALEVSPDGSRLAVCSTHGQINVWDTSSGQLLLNTVTSTDPITVSLAFSPDNSLLATAGYSGTVRFWPLK